MWSRLHRRSRNGSFPARSVMNAEWANVCVCENVSWIYATRIDAHPCWRRNIMACHMQNRWTILIEEHRKAWNGQCAYSALQKREWMARPCDSDDAVGTHTSSSPLLQYQKVCRISNLEMDIHLATGMCLSVCLSVCLRSHVSLGFTNFTGRKERRDTGVLSFNIHNKNDIRNRNAHVAICCRQWIIWTFIWNLSSNVMMEHVGAYW